MLRLIYISLVFGFKYLAVCAAEKYGKFSSELGNVGGKHDTLTPLARTFPLLLFK